MTVPEAFTLALQQHQQGRLSEAETIYRQILAAQPNHSEAMHMLGVVAHQSGRHELAVEWIGRALVIDPKNGAAYSNLGEAYRALHRLDEAIASYRHALEYRPDDALAWNNLGIALAGRCEVEASARAFGEAVRLQPSFAQAHTNQGIALAGQRRFDEAIACHTRALTIKPDYAEASYNLGIALAANGRLGEAVEAYRTALKANPDLAQASNNLGIALDGQGQPQEAIDAFRRALTLRPDFAEAHNNLANAYREIGKLDEAEAAVRQALHLRAEYAEGHNTLANTLRDQGRLDEASAGYRRAVQIQPRNSTLRSNLILTLHFHPQQDANAIAEEQRLWREHVETAGAPSVPSHPRDRNPQRRLRIGYVSSGFCDHVLGRNLLPLFRSHDHIHFEIVCYSGVIDPDDFTQEFASLADRWSSIVGASDDDLAKMIRADEVDILVDLHQHMGGNRLPVFAQIPAPVQVSFGGYPESAGVDTIRYRISDRWLERNAECGMRSVESGAEAVGTAEFRIPNSEFGIPERVFLLDSFWCYDPCGMEVPVQSLPAATNGWITFASLCNFFKINEPVLKLWARALAEVKHSRLLLLSGEGSHRERTWEFLERLGVERARVEFVGRCSRRSYLELYHRADIALDPFPYGGHTTSLDALWMGVPVVSRAGERRVSRAGLSILSNLGLPELVAHTDDEYTRIAVELAGDLDRLTALRARLRPRMEASVVMDAPRFARQIEAAYRSMWEECCSEGTQP